MTLLDEIIDDASGDQVPVPTLLRRLKVLAARTKTTELEDWVEKELAGYSLEDTLPGYRGPFPAEVVGHLAGPFGSGIQNSPIPQSAFPASLHKLFEASFMMPASELEGLAKGDNPIKGMWPADFIAYANTLISQGKVSIDPNMALLQAWRQITREQIHGVLDAIRTRILNFSLAVEKLSPDAGEKFAPAPEERAMHAIVTNYIYGGQTNLAIASSDVDQRIRNVERGDEKGLLEALREAGIENVLVEQLHDALQGDRRENDNVDPPSPGRRVNEWLGRLSLGATRASGQVATGTAAGVATELVKAYFGM